MPEPVVRNPNDHYPSFRHYKTRCRFCNDLYTTCWCNECNMPLCLLSIRNCFERYHTRVQDFHLNPRLRRLLRDHFRDRNQLVHFNDNNMFSIKIGENEYRDLSREGSREPGTTDIVKTKNLKMESGTRNFYGQYEKWLKENAPRNQCYRKFGTIATNCIQQQNFPINFPGNQSEYHRQVQTYASTSVDQRIVPSVSETLPVETLRHHFGNLATEKPSNSNDVITEKTTREISNTTAQPTEFEDHLGQTAKFEAPNSYKQIEEQLESSRNPKVLIYPAPELTVPPVHENSPDIELLLRENQRINILSQLTEVVPVVTSSNREPSEIFDKSTMCSTILPDSLARMLFRKKTAVRNRLEQFVVQREQARQEDFKRESEARKLRLASMINSQRKTDSSNLVQPRSLPVKRPREPKNLDKQLPSEKIERKCPRKSPALKKTSVDKMRQHKFPVENLVEKYLTSLRHEASNGPALSNFPGYQMQPFQTELMLNPQTTAPLPPVQFNFADHSSEEPVVYHSVVAKPENQIAYNQPLPHQQPFQTVQTNFDHQQQLPNFEQFYQPCSTFSKEFDFISQNDELHLIPSTSNPVPYLYENAAIFNGYPVDRGHSDQQSFYGNQLPQGSEPLMCPGQSLQSNGTMVYGAINSFGYDQTNVSVFVNEFSSSTVSANTVTFDKTMIPLGQFNGPPNLS